MVLVQPAKFNEIDSFLRNSHIWESGSELMLVYGHGEGLDGLLRETVSQLMTA